MYAHGMWQKRTHWMWCHIDFMWIQPRWIDLNQFCRNSIPSIRWQKDLKQQMYSVVFSAAFTPSSLRPTLVQCSNQWHLLCGNIMMIGFNLMCHTRVWWIAWKCHLSMNCLVCHMGKVQTIKKRKRTKAKYSLGADTHPRPSIDWKLSFFTQ